MALIDDPISAAACAPTTVVDPLPDLPPVAPSALTAMRENTELSLNGPSWWRYATCAQRARGWVDPCSPAYTGELGTDTGPARYDPNVEGGGLAVSALDADHKQSTVGDMAFAEFRPFTFYSLGTVNNIDPRFDLQQAGRRQVEADTAWWVTAEIDHAPLSGNPSLRTLGWDLTPPGGPVAVGHALMVLMRAYARQGMAGFVLWAPWWLQPAMERAGLVTSRGPVVRTVSNIPVVFGPGLTGVRPLLDADGDEKAVPPDVDAPDDGEIAIYATRSVAEYRLGPVDDYPLPDDHRPVRTNQSWAESFRTAAARFDPGCVYSVAVRADINDN